MAITTTDPVILIVDGPDPDNYVLALAATSETFALNVVAVVMTGRPVSIDHSAPEYAFNPHASRAVRRDNALHMKGIFMRHGREHIPVFEGLRAPFSTVPHKFHIHERVTDIHDDAHAGHQLAGDIDDAVEFLSNIPGTIHVVCGGPMTDLAYFMHQPVIMNKLGIVTAQLGMFGLGDVKTIAGGRRQFNALADAKATREVLIDYPQPVYLLPTDITKMAEHAFNHPDEIMPLATSGAFAEIVEMYRAAWPIMWDPRGEKIFMHDFHPAELMWLLLNFGPDAHHEIFSQHSRDTIGRYTVSRVGIEHVPHEYHDLERWGEIDLGIPQTDSPLRFLVDGADPRPHRGVIGAALNSAAAPASQLQRA